MYYSGASSLVHLSLTDNSTAGTQNLVPEKCLQNAVTSIERTALFKGKGHFLSIQKLPLARKKWLTTKSGDNNRCID